MDIDVNYIIEELMDSGAFEMILGVFAVVFAIFAIVGLVFYILRAVALFTMGKNRGVRLYGLAWVPIANGWVLGGIADAHDKYENKDYKWRHILLWLNVGISAATLLMIASLSKTTVSAVNAMQGMTDPEDMVMSIVTTFSSVSSLWSLVILASTALSICTYIAYFKMLESCTPNSCVILLLVCLLIQIAEPIVLMCIRNKNADADYEEYQRAIPAYQPQTDAPEEQQ